MPLSILFIGVLLQIFSVAFGGSIGTFGVLSPLPPLCFREETGSIVSMEVTSCSSGSDNAPCGMSLNFYYEIAVGFVPFISTEVLYMGLKFHPDGVEAQELSEIIIPGGFIAGRGYRVASQIQAPFQFAGKRGRMEVWLRTEKGGGSGEINKSIINRCFHASIAGI